MDDEVGPEPPGGISGDDGTGAVLYGMFTSFTEALGDLEERLAAIEAAVRAGPPELALRLVRLEELIDQRAALADQIDQRAAALAEQLDSLRALLEAHVDETAHSLGRRAGEAGRRLASELGLRGRPKPPPLGH